MYEKILKWYKQGLWNETMVRNAATKKVITEEQTNKILNSKEG
jgi:hypothetical protein